MSDVTTAPPLLAIDRSLVKRRGSAVIEKVIFLSLVLLVPTMAIPYGTAEAWWKALFICAILTLTILWLIDGFLTAPWIPDGKSVVLPIATLAVFSLLQSLQFTQATARPGGITIAPWNTASVDPLQTRFFAFQLISLMMVGVFLFRYATTENRLRLLINAVLGVAAASAIFGILRQTAQHGIGFGLPLLAANQGYAQFINKNHFAFLMEMALGLILGLVIGGGIKREHLLIYVTLLLPIWAALGLCGSRGGLVAMLAQVITAGLVPGLMRRDRDGRAMGSRVAHLAQSFLIRTVLIVLLVAGVTLGTLWLGGERLATRIEESGDQLTAPPDQNRDAVSRNDIWQTTWKMFAANRLVGVGMGAYWAAVPAFHNASGGMTPQEAHNDYLELLASGGIIGLAVGVWFMVMLVRKTRENLRSPDRFHRAACLGALIGLTGVLVHSLLDFGLHIMLNALIFTTLVVIATSKPRSVVWKAEETICKTQEM